MTTVYAPFRDLSSFDREEQETPPPPAARAWSPFVSAYETEESEASYDEPTREEYATLVNELYDEEFDEALYELVNEARSLHDSHINSGHSVAEADRVVTQHFTELIRESEAVVDTIAREVTSREDAFLDGEIDQFVERYAPSTHLEPAFEDFLKSLGKKLLKGAAKVAGKAVQAAKAVALGPMFAQVKLLLNPLLKNVMQKAIGKLPVALQPVARTVAQRLGFTVAAPTPAAPAPAPAAAAVAEPSAAVPSGGPEATTPAPVSAAPPPEDAGSPVQADAGGDVSEMQLEFDELLAEAMLSPEEPEVDLEIARARNGVSMAAEHPVFRDLEEARDRFAQEIENLREGENPEPHVENFVAAALPAVRLGIRVIGRPRVVSFLAGLLGRLLSRLVGPAQTPALSRAIVDAGLKLLSLEVTEENEKRLASSAIVGTVEETLRRVASLPDHVLEDQTLLEGFALEAFEQAAAANLPAVFSDSTYRNRPDLLEGGVNAAWIMLPMRRPCYKRCSRVFNVKITPHMAEAVETFEDSRLSDYFQDQLGLPEGEDVEAEIHLFETITGGTAADVARLDSETSGLGAGDGLTVSQLQPLTPEAAEVLLGKPGLGRPLPPGASVRTVPAGQRLYVIAGRRPLLAPGRAGLRRMRRLAHLKAVIDCPGNQLRLSVFLSEVKAQRLAVRLRQQGHAGSISVGFNRLVGRRLPPILRGKRQRRLRIVHPGLPPGSGSLAVLQQLQTAVPNVFVAKVQEWVVRAFTDFVKTGTDKFLAAAQDPSDGVTLKFTIEQPPAMKELCAVLVGKGATPAQVADAAAKGAPASVRVDALPGHKCD